MRLTKTEIGVLFLICLCCLTSVLSVIVSGCTPQPVRGVVIKKNYRAAWTQLVVSHAGKSTVLVPVYHPPQWDVVVQGVGNTAETQQFLIILDQPTWDRTHVGDDYNNTKVEN